MKKRVLAFASAIVMVITMVCVGGLSLPATAESDGITETNGLYDVYASGGTYGSETVSSANTKLNTNGDNAAAVGGDYGIGINRPGQKTYSYTVGTDDATYVVDKDDNTGYVSANNQFNNRVITETTADNNGDINFSATLKLAAGMLDFNLYFIDFNKKTSTVTVEVSNSVGEGASWRPITTERKEYDAGSIVASTSTIIGYSPAEDQLRADDQYVRFTYLFKDRESDFWAFSFGKADWVCEDSAVYSDPITMDMVVASDELWVEKATSASSAGTPNFFYKANASIDAAQSPSYYNLRKNVAGPAYATFYSADADVYAAKFRYATYYAQTVTVSLAANYDDFAAGTATKLTVTQAETGETTWCTSYEVTATGVNIPEGMRYVRITVDSDDGASGSGFNNAYFNLYQYQLGTKVLPVESEVQYQHVTTDDIASQTSALWYEYTNTSNGAYVASSNFVLRTNSSGVTEAQSPSAVNLRKNDAGPAYATFCSPDFDLQGAKFYYASVYEHTVTVSMAAEYNDFADGTAVAIETTNAVADGSYWAKRYEVCVADGQTIPAGMRYVRIKVEPPASGEGTFNQAAFNLYAYDLGYKPAAQYEASVTYRTVNMTDFAAQFNFLAGATEYTTVKAYVADTDNERYYREIALERTAGTLDGATAPTEWEAYVYTPAEGEELGDYIKFVMSQPTDSTSDSVQFMGLSYTADDENLKVYDFSSLEIKQENEPARRNRIFSNKADINNAADMGGYRFYYINGEYDGTANTEGVLVYDFESLANFRVFVSTVSAPAALDLRFYVACDDDDAMYTEIETKYEYGYRTEAGSYESYAFTPCDPAEIPAGARYLKIVATGKDAARIIRLEGDQHAEPQPTVIVRKVDTSVTTDLAAWSNITTKGDEGLRIDSGEKGAYVSFKNNYATYAKATVTLAAEFRDKLDIYWTVGDKQVDTVVTYIDDTTAQVRLADKVEEPLASTTWKLTVGAFGTAETAYRKVFIKDIYFYEAIESSVTVADAANGTVTVDNETAYYKQVVTVTATPEAGYVLQDLQVVAASGAEIAVAEDLTFVMPSEPVAVTPVFHAETFTVTEGADSENGTFTVDTASAVSGTKVTVTTTADEGYQANAVTVTGTRFGEVEVTKEANGTFTFVLPKDDVTVDVTFGVRELDSAIATVLGGSTRDDSAKGDGYRGLRFTAKAVFTVNDNAHTIQVDGTTYSVSSFGFLVMKKDRAEAFAEQAIAEGKGTEMAIQNQLADGRYLKAVEAKMLTQNELDGNKRTVQYTAVVTGLTDALQYQWLLARPYYICKNAETGETVHFYGSTTERDLYHIDLEVLQLENPETTALNSQLNEAVLLPNEGDEVSDNDWVNLANTHVKEGSVQVFVPDSSNFDSINSVIGGVKYAVEGVDYEIDYENGRIRRLPTSTVINNYYNNALYALEAKLDAAVAAGQAFGGGSISYPYAYNDVVYVSYDYVEQDEVNESISAHLKDYMADRAGLSDEFKTLVEDKAAVGETLTYLVIGDSISTGGDAIHDGYEWTYYGRFEAWLEQAYPGLEVDVVNYAVAGATSAGGLTHITAALADGIQPDLVSIAFGMNDQNLGSGETNKDTNDYAAYIANYDAMLAHLKTNAPNAEVVGITPMPACPLWTGCSYDATATTTLASAGYAKSLHEWGDTNGLAVAPVNEAFVYSHDTAGKSWAELIITAINHPGQYGHGLYFEALKALF